MNSKGFNKFSWPLTVAAVVFAAAVGGCARTHVYEDEERGGRVTRTHPAQRGIDFGLGVLGAGASAVFGSRSESEQQKEKTPEDTEQERKEAEKAKNQY